MTSYAAFLASKRLTVPNVGIDVDPTTLHPDMKDHQRAVCAWAIKKGRAAVWLETGQGKSLVGLGWAQALGQRTLWLAPLGAAQQLVNSESPKWGIPAVYARTEHEAPGQEPRVHDLADPLPTVTGDGAGQLVQPVVVKVNHGDKPGTSVVVKIDHGQQAGPSVRSTEEPLYTLTTKRSLGLAEPILKLIESGEVDPRRVVLIDGVPHLLDIRFRMLTNRELARAMGFDDAEVEYEFVGTVEQVTRQIGNAVPVRTACALVTSILNDRGAVS